LHPSGPFPVLALHGEQGSAKSTLARVLRACVDPNVAPLRRPPRNERDLLIAATNAWVMALDNLSMLPPWLSDALCCLSTGGGLGTRELYTNTDEVLFDAMRPVILTGIAEVGTRGDLLDRSLVIYLPEIPENKRRPEKEFWAEFNAAHARILGALLDVIVVARRNLASTRLAGAPRLADFAVCVVASEPGLGWPHGAFLKAYSGNRKAATDVVLDATPLTEPVCALAAGLGVDATAGSILQDLRELVSEEIVKRRSWPKSPRALSVALRRLAPNLRTIGIHVHFGNKSPGPNSRRLIAIHMAEACTDASDAAANPATQGGRLRRPTPTPRRAQRRKTQGRRANCVDGVDGAATDAS